MTLADLNGDGYPDIVAANRGDFPDLVDGKPGKGPQVPTPSYVCLNDGRGHFPACQPLPTESATSIAAADFDGDGALDLFVAHRDGGQSIVLWNDGKGHFLTSTKVGAAKAWIRMGAAGDLDGDGRPDLAIIDERLKATFIIFNRGGRHFGEPVRLRGPERPPYCVAIADLNRDKEAAGHYRRARGVARVGILQHRAGTHVPRGPVERWQGHRVRLAFADFDGDGRPDIVAARSDAPNAIWFSTKPAAH